LAIGGGGEGVIGKLKCEQMYIQEGDMHKDVFNEVYRVLTPGGRGAAYYVELAERAGFKAALQREEKQRFFLELVKL